MILVSDHATVYTGIVVTDHVQQAVLLSMAGPRTAVKAIYAALCSSHHPWPKLYEVDAHRSTDKPRLPPDRPGSRFVRSFAPLYTVVE
jgi:hypothetical protein